MDYSFLRFRDNFKDATTVEESPLVNIEYTGQVHLKPGEAYFQITNLPTGIYFNDSYSVYLVNDCNVELEDITDYFFMQSFTDRNGRNQLAWELVNSFDYSGALSIKLVNNDNGQTFWTNFFQSTLSDIDFTTRFDYRHSTELYGTAYDRAPFYQSIRLRSYFANPVNESTRDEYHQISTDVTVATRNIKKIKYRYLADQLNSFTAERLETLLSCDEFYVDTIRSYSTEPLDFKENILSSNISQNEFIVSRDRSQIFVFGYQLFTGVEVSMYSPFGIYTTGSLPNDGTITFGSNITLNTGEITLYSGSTVLAVFNQAQMSVNNGTVTIPNITSAVPGDGQYHFNITEGLFSVLGINSLAVTDSNTWKFSVQPPDYDSNDYSNDYLI